VALPTRAIRIFMPSMKGEPSEADLIQTAIYRKMAPEQRLAQAMRMNRQMRSLMDAGLRQQKPAWTDEERRVEIARRILHAATG
jgi:hypothetical protein